VVSELGKEADEEDGHLRVAEVAEQPLPVGGGEVRPGMGGSLVVRLSAAGRVSQRVEAEVDEVGGADAAQGQEGQPTAMMPTAISPRRRWGEVFAVTPATLLARHRRLVARR
jgi:hypothetical protein